MKSNSFHLINESATIDFGIELFKYIDLKKHTLIFFQGEIGAGKTTLIRSLFQILGVKPPIKSPTFSLMESYTVNSFPIYHFDLYRLADPEELEYLGWRDCFSQPSLCCIEWPEKAQGYLPKPDILIDIKSCDVGRELTMTVFEGRD